MSTVDRSGAGRGDDPRKKLTEWPSSEERKITATLVSVGGLEGGWSELKRGFPKVGSHGPLLSRALTRLAGDLVIHWGSSHHAGAQGRKNISSKICKHPRAGQKPTRRRPVGGTQAQQWLSKLQHAPIRTILFNCIRDPVSHATGSLYCLDPRPPAGVNSQVPFSKWYLRPFGFK